MTESVWVCVIILMNLPYVKHDVYENVSMLVLVRCSRCNVKGGSLRRWTSSSSSSSHQLCLTTDTLEIVFTVSLSKTLTHSWASRQTPTAWAPSKKQSHFTPQNCSTHLYKSIGTPNLSHHDMMHLWFGWWFIFTTTLTGGWGRVDQI